MYLLTTTYRPSITVKLKEVIFRETRFPTSKNHPLYRVISRDVYCEMRKKSDCNKKKKRKKRGKIRKEERWKRTILEFS